MSVTGIRHSVETSQPQDLKTPGPVWLSVFLFKARHKTMASAFAFILSSSLDWSGEILKVQSIRPGQAPPPACLSNVLSRFRPGSCRAAPRLSLKQRAETDDCIHSPEPRCIEVCDWSGGNYSRSATLETRTPAD